MFSIIEKKNFLLFLYCFFINIFSVKPVPMLKVEPYYSPNQTVEISCDVATFPSPIITWSFIKYPYYPSYENATTIRLTVCNISLK